MREDREKLIEMIEVVERIARYAQRGREAFDQDELVQIWIVHHLQLIGEAARSLSSAFRDHHEEIPWCQIIGMRNILIHHYFAIDVEAVWSVVETHLPLLKRQHLEILNP